MDDLVERLRHELLIEKLPDGSTLTYRKNPDGHEAAARITALEASLKKANAQTEHFEREWYLRGDQVEQMTAENARLKTSIKLQDMLIDSLAADKAGLVEVLQECADDLESEIEARRDCDLPRRIERDLATVVKARAALDLHGGTHDQ